MTEIDLYNYIISDCTVNEARWIKDRNKIRLVTNAIHLKNKINSKFKEVMATDSQKEAIKTILGKK